jgi:hypothetical protein
VKGMSEHRISMRGKKSSLVERISAFEEEFCSMELVYTEFSDTTSM